MYINGSASSLNHMIKGADLDPAGVCIMRKKTERVSSIGLSWKLLTPGNHINLLQRLRPNNNPICMLGTICFIFF